MAQSSSLTHQDVQTYCQQTTYQFDLIVANPPYFAQGVECKNDERALARYVQQSHLDWLNWASSCLPKKGRSVLSCLMRRGKH